MLTLLDYGQKAAAQYVEICADLE